MYYDNFMIFLKLFRASQNGYVEQVNCLISAGAKCAAYKNIKCTPLYAAIRGGHVSIVKKLLTHFPDAINVSIRYIIIQVYKINRIMIVLSFKGYDFRELVTASCGLYQWQE